MFKKVHKCSLMYEHMFEKVRVRTQSNTIEQCSNKKYRYELPQ